MSDERQDIESGAEPSRPMSEGLSFRTEDITGLNKTRKVDLKPGPSATGKRLSRKAKQILLLGAGTTGLLIVAGVMMAGHHGTEGTGQGLSTGNDNGQIGMAEPPSPPPILAPTPAEKPVAKAVGAGAQSAQSLPTKTGTAPHNGIERHPYGRGGAGLSASASAAGQYRQWRESQRYHFLESQIKADYSAYGAPLATAGGASQAGLPGGGADQTMRQLAQTQVSMLHKIGSQGQDAALGMNGAGGGSTGYDQGDGGSPGNGSWAEKQGKAGSGYLDAKLRNPASRHEIFAGSVIPAELVAGIDYDLAGRITA